MNPEAEFAAVSMTQPHGGEMQDTLGRGLSAISMNWSVKRSCRGSEGARTAGSGPPASPRNMDEARNAIWNVRSQVWKRDLAARSTTFMRT